MPPTNSTVHNDNMTMENFEIFLIGMADISFIGLRFNTFNPTKLIQIFQNTKTGRQHGFSIDIKQARKRPGQFLDRATLYNI